jgi:hypothetical protein
MNQSSLVASLMVGSLVGGVFIIVATLLRFLAQISSYAQPITSSKTAYLWNEMQMQFWRDRYDVQWHYAGTHGLITGKLSDLLQVEYDDGRSDDDDDDSELDNTPHCYLSMKKGRIIFGFYLQEQERKALIAVINDYINAQRA